ncbi:MAG: transcriptional repressor [Flavobacteriaceae bacterium]
MSEKNAVEIMDLDCLELLDGKGLKKTRLRIQLLQYFKDTTYAQSYGDLKKALGAHVDKSTLYRNLTTFEEKGLIHGINDHSGITKYALGASPSSGHEHAHFVCECCEIVYCVKDVEQPQYEVPPGFKPKNVQTIIHGICSNC